MIAWSSGNPTDGSIENQTGVVKPNTVGMHVSLNQNGTPNKSYEGESLFNFKTLGTFKTQGNQ